MPLGMLHRCLSRRAVLGAGLVAAGASAFTIAPAQCKKTLELARSDVDTIKASLERALAKPVLVHNWIDRQGEHAWLEEVLGTEALEWVRAGNAEALTRIGGDPTGSPLYERLYSILTSKEKIPHISKIGDSYYNFWTDADNPRGLLRRTSLESYRSGQPEWEVVISIDELNKLEGESWVFKGQSLYRPRDDTAPTRTLLQLSRGGADATVLREFDLHKKAFVPQSEGGFVVPEAKTRAAWRDADTLLIGTDFTCDGADLTDSG